MAGEKEEGGILWVRWRRRIVKTGKKGGEICKRWDRKQQEREEVEEKMEKKKREGTMKGNKTGDGGEEGKEKMRI